ncbi:hypothetical protein ECE50_014425 [Chitinophaga sp. Mgbs1]|uniref:DUF5683 domain-containing protein n=1 Tax=Chitinophaga solisilvae TaxID=1233460 RepID=A0A433WBW8_9BACT|nr:hypothetical protein [Chitinophaga solisilvae]
MANKAGKIFHLFRNNFLVLLATVMVTSVQAQDTSRAAAVKPIDTLVRPATQALTDTAAGREPVRLTMDAPPPHSPRKAALFSAIVPGLGQIYNREYWKVPLVYAAIGTCTYFFIWNMGNYKDYRDAYRLAMDGNPDTNTPNQEIASHKYSPENLKIIRDYYRQNLDYSVLFFILAYGLNIADATVFAHLRSFDMSDDLSMRISPALINNRTLGISVNLSIGGKKAKKQPYFAGRW